MTGTPAAAGVPDLNKVSRLENDKPMQSGNMLEDLSTAELSHRDFEKIRAAVHRLCGINLHTGKEGLVKSRLAKRLRALGLGDFRSYVDYVENDRSGKELATMIDILTTNKTSFFREPNHFKYLRNDILSNLGSAPARIWSAGCSSGEEPYTIAISVSEALGASLATSARILATDISARMLERARQGVFEESSLDGISPGLRAKYFTRVRGGDSQAYRVCDSIRSMVHFARLNLLSDWPMRGPFDVIFCRNVMIYFDGPTRAGIVHRFWQSLEPAGHLIVGHSESLLGSKQFTYVQPAVYVKEMGKS
jgi:chemotaxis protein methyltransferase CheR